jgi:hypothetical protein
LEKQGTLVLRVKYEINGRCKQINQIKLIAKAKYIKYLEKQTINLKNLDK